MSNVCVSVTPTHPHVRPCVHTSPFTLSFNSIPPSPPSFTRRHNFKNASQNSPNMTTAQCKQVSGSPLITSTAHLPVVHLTVHDHSRQVHTQNMLGQIVWHVHPALMSKVRFVQVHQVIILVLLVILSTCPHPTTRDSCHHCASDSMVVWLSTYGGGCLYTYI